MDGKPELLQEVLALMHAPYLSDLKKNKAAARCAASLAGSRYPLSEWRDAVAYLTGGQAPVDSEEQARAILLDYAQR